MQKTLGAYKVATELRTNGIDTTVINHLHVFEIDEIKYLLSELINENTLFVGINNFYYKNIAKNFSESTPGSILPHGIEYNKEIKQLIKSLNPNCKLVLGGATAQDASYNKDFDYVVSGYADSSIVELSKHLISPEYKIKKSFKSIFGFIVINDTVAEQFDFVHSKTIYQHKDIILPGEVLTLEMARGCIFKCTFCSYPLNGKKKFDYIKHDECVYQELMDNYEKFGTTKYFFVDDTFNDSVEKCQRILNISKRLPFQLEYWAYMRLDLLAAHPETIDMLLESGAKCMFFGIETFDPKAAKTIKKSSNRARLIETLELIKSKAKKSINLYGNFIFGLPYETEESIKKTVEWLTADDCPLDSWWIEVLSIKMNPKNWSSGFISEIDADPGKFGYRAVGTVNTTDMLWESDLTSYNRMVEMVREAEKQMTKIPSTVIMELSGLGLDLDFLLQKDFKSLNWEIVEKVKQRRAEMYKKELYKALNISAYNN